MKSLLITYYFIDKITKHTLTKVCLDRLKAKDGLISPSISSIYKK
jgi:hypothetical protein